MKVAALSPEKRQRLRAALQSVGGLPEKTAPQKPLTAELCAIQLLLRAGVCVGVPDVFSSSWSQKLRDPMAVEAEVHFPQSHGVLRS